MGGDLAGLAEGPLALGRLLLEDVARVRVTAADLALGGQLEALLRARMGLHLRHGGRRRIAKVAHSGSAAWGATRDRARTAARPRRAPSAIALPRALVAGASREGQPPAPGVGARTASLCVRKPHTTRSGWVRWRGRPEVVGRAGAGGRKWSAALTRA